MPPSNRNARLTLGIIGQSPPLSSAAYSPDGKLVATAGEDNGVGVWEIATGELLRTIGAGGHTDIINTVAFSPDGKFLVTASEDKTAKLWNVESGALALDLTAHTDSVNSARFSRDTRDHLASHRHFLFFLS